MPVRVPFVLMMMALFSTSVHAEDAGVIAFRGMKCPAEPPSFTVLN
jgi:hypothetical protein